jgi:hypothetical protein
MTTTDDTEIFPLLRPDDPEQRRLYLSQLRWRHPDECNAVDPDALERVLHAALEACVLLRINDPKEILRFVALPVLLTRQQKQSQLLTNVIYRVIVSSRSWGARKRLDFIYKLVVGRAPPDPEPDFGVWCVLDPRDMPPVSPQALQQSIFSLLPSAPAN